MMKIWKVLLWIIGVIVGIAAVVGMVVFIMERIEDKKNIILRPAAGFYERYLKRPFDAILSTGALIVFSPILLVTALLVRVKLGSPVLFTQPRPGRIDPDTGKERIFKLYKFRTMTDERDKNGKLKSDAERLTSFGKILRKTSLDELPELFNIIKGDMAVLGPRPQLVRDMVFMSLEQRQRHTVRPGLSGLAQVNGRNGISWEEKLDWDLKYIENIKFATDADLVFQTFHKAGAQEGITDGENATALDFGDALLKECKITQEQYNQGQEEAKAILNQI